VHFRLLSFLDKIFQFILMKFVVFYRTFLSVLFRQAGGKCRFYPTCSTYAVEALKVHGGFKGGWLALKRFLKCGPFHPGGVDMVPPPNSSKCCHENVKNKEING
tara:strand:+ start:2158 stop:2469 length:312 start_codon:yes stop_codon:yes gene_type:complete